MIRKLKLFIIIIRAAVFAIGVGALFMCPTNVNAAPDFINGNITDAGSMVTQGAKDLFVNSVGGDIDKFSNQFQKNIVQLGAVPIEAKLGRVFMGAMSRIADVLNRSLVPFIKILLIVLFAFWIFFETYNMMESVGDTKKLWQSIIWKAVIIGFWFWLIDNNTAEIFMWIFGPILSFGSYLSKFILDSVVGASGIPIADSCAAIHQYMNSGGSDFALISPDAAADLLCVPTRVSGFFYTCIAEGFKWMIAGIGQSIFTFIVGAVFVGLFIYNIWKFAFMTLNVVADLFFALMLLPFTALAECFGGGTSYGGIAGKFFKDFAKIFDSAKLESIILKFINSAIYFVSLSLVIAVCAAILSSVIDFNFINQIPTIDNNNFMTVLIVGFLVAYLARKSGEIATQIGGKLEGDFGDKLGKDISGLYQSGKNWGQNAFKAIRKK